MTREGGHRKVAAINQNFEGIGFKLGVLQMHEKWNLEVWFHDLGNLIQGFEADLLLDGLRQDSVLGMEVSGL
jgi:hypothetical protein